jgi:hypothetical protein
MHTSLRSAASGNCRRCSASTADTETKGQHGMECGSPMSLHAAAQSPHEPCMLPRSPPTSRACRHAVPSQAVHARLVAGQPSKMRVARACAACASSCARSAARRAASPACCSSAAALAASASDTARSKSPSRSCSPPPMHACRLQPATFPASCRRGGHAHA